MEPFRYNTPDFPKEWPESYYAAEQPKERYAALQNHLAAYPDSLDDRRRLELFQKRYNDKFDDAFMLGWMMLKVVDSQSGSSFSRPRYRHEVETELKRLLVIGETVDDFLIAEWTAFADQLIHTYLNSSPYRSMLFGIGTWSQSITAQRFAREIILVTKTVPGRIGMEAAMAPLGDLIQKRFAELVPDGRSYLDAALEAAR